MKISAKNGILITAAGLIGLFITFWASFSDCYKSECSEQTYSIAGIISFLVIVSGLAILLIGVIKLAKSDPKNRAWLILIVFLYLLIALGAYYYFLGGKSYFEAKSFQSKFKTTYFKATYLPDGYIERYTIYSSSDNEPGNYASTQFGRPLIDDHGNTYYEEFSLEQGDVMNNAAGILAFCGKTYECDVIDGENVKNIYCQRTNRYLCSVKFEGTYVSISSSNNLSREDSVAILDSLVQK